MDRFRPDEDNSIEPSQLTAEQILAEFWAEREREEAQPPQPMAAETPGPETEPEEDVRVYVPEKQRRREAAPAPQREEPPRAREEKPRRESRREKSALEWRPRLEALFSALGKKEKRPERKKRTGASQPRPSRPAPEPESQEELSLSVADILAEYYSEPLTEPAPRLESEPEYGPESEPEPGYESEPEYEPGPEYEPEPEPEQPPEPEPEEPAHRSREEKRREPRTIAQGLFDRAAAWLQARPTGQPRPQVRPEPEIEEPEDDPPPEPEPEAMPAPRPRRERRDSEQELDFSHMSIDEILAEFKGEQEAEPAPEMSPEQPPRAETTEETRPSLFEAAPAEQDREPQQEQEPADRRESKLARQARDARRFIAEMEQTDYAGIREEAAYDRPAFHLDWDTGPQAGKTPTDEESFDPRFHLDGQRPRQMVYGDRALDLSPEEGYVPPRPREESVSAPESEERAEEAPGFFQRLLSSRKKRPTFSEQKPAARPVPEPPVPEQTQTEEASPEESRADEPAAEELWTAETLSRTEETEPAPSQETLTEQPLSDQSAEPEQEETSQPRETSGGFQELNTGYAPRREYTVEQVELPPEAGDDFPSFGQYLMGLVSNLLVRARGYGGKSTASAETDEEELGPEVSPADGMKHYAAFIPFLRLRFRIGLVLLVIMLWISLGLPVSGALRSAPVASAMVLGLQLCIMLLCLDVVTNAALNLVRLRFGADTLAVFACLLTGLDALLVAAGVGSAHMPLCLISSLALMGVLLSSLLSTRALRKTLRVPAIGKLKAAVTGEESLAGGDLTLIKSARSVKGFVHRTEEMPPDEWLFLRLSPLMLLLALLLGLIVAAVKKDFGNILYIWSALLCPAIPIGALLCFALPFFLGANRNFRFAAAIAGWSGLRDIGRSRNLIVTDRDLFPEGTIRMGLMRILAESRPEQILTYAGSMVAASGIGFGSCFAEEMEHCGCQMRQVENFEFLPGGGMRGIIDSQVVLCGSTELMRLMNVWVPDELVTKTSVLLAVDGILQGIFNLEYTPRDSVRAALVALIRSNRHPIFAIRDFNVTPAMLRDCFDLSTDGYDFPPYVDRFALSEASPDPNSKIAALLCREGLESMIQMADTGRGMYTAVRLNLFLTILGVVLGLLFVFTRLLSAGVIGAGSLLVLALICALPVFLLSFVLQR